VFSNWLLMYLSDEEVEALAVKALNWVSSSSSSRRQCTHQQASMHACRGMTQQRQRLVTEAAHSSERLGALSCTSLSVKLTV
jgi:hypothetical protein